MFLAALLLRTPLSAAICLSFALTIGIEYTTVATAQSRRSGPQAEIASELEDERIKTQATEAIHGIIEGLNEGDYALFTSRFSDTMKKAQTREAFLELQKDLQKKLGTFRSVHYLGFYAQHRAIVTLFKARFAKEPEDVLVKLVMERVKSSPRVTGLWLDSPRLAK